MISPGRDGHVYLTPDKYASGREARERLALPVAPTGYFEVPEERLSDPTPPRPVEASGALPGGGIEVTVTHSVDVRFLPWRGIPPA